MSSRKIVLVSLILTFYSVHTLPKRQAGIVDYLAHMAAALQMQHFGVFNCWLLQFSNGTNLSPLLTSIVQRLSNEHISLVQADHSGRHIPTHQEPNMVIMLWGNEQQMLDQFYINQWLWEIPSDCRTIVLFELDASGASSLPWQIGEYFESLMLYYVACIAINKNALFSFHYQPLRIVSHSCFPDLSELFFDRLQTIQNKQFAAGYMKDHYTAMYCGQMYGEDTALFLLFVDRLGLTLQLQEVLCDGFESLVSCVARYNGIHFLLNRLYFTQYNKHVISASAMEQFTIATPKGRLLTVWEILLKPFHHSAWGLILGILVTLQLINQLKPTLFSNNLLALALFGFEKHQLRLTKRVEKATAFALIVLFFQLKCAYEAKLVSYIAEPPRLPDAASIEDLRERNIIVHSRKINIMEDDKLNGIVEFYDGVHFKFDGLTLLENRVALVLEKLFADSVEGHGMLYTILQENVYETLPFYALGAKSLLRRRFQTFQQHVFEAGMQQHLRQKQASCLIWYIVKSKKIPGAFDGSSAVIRFDHLKPLMLFFLGQWVLEVMVFMIEMLVERYKRSRRV
ncbi:AGAP006691-PA [Anopheles gambiae str. PEST]|uniref:AGAP006691-PA n=1 Tax=Anopheles gambiae TaxID=7165 RepID=A7UUI4_ANOGA|nr:AGAP006691-PA [Anopheles gambiae str. PEST]